MPSPRKSASNAARSADTRAALLIAARALFVAKGFHATSTPEIVARAGVTRGALYHHYADKIELFAAVLRREAAAVAAEVAAATASHAAPRRALLTGASAWFTAMEAPGRIRLLLQDGPAVLGREAMDRIDIETGARKLPATLAAAHCADTASFTPLLSAAYDRAATEIAAGRPRAALEQAIARLISAALP